MLTDFTAKNGATTFRPGSQRRPTYPRDVDKFYRHMVQPEGQAGDVIIFGGWIQHCAMANNDLAPRVGIVQSMIPVYVKPYQDIELCEEMLFNVSMEMRSLLALDHPYPMKKHM